MVKRSPLTRTDGVRTGVEEGSRQSKKSLWGQTRQKGTTAALTSSYLLSANLPRAVATTDRTSSSFVIGSMARGCALTLHPHLGA